MTTEGVLGYLSYQSGITRYDLTLMLTAMYCESGYVSSSSQIGEWTEVDKVNVTGSESLTMANKRRRYRVVTVAGIPPFVYKETPANGTGTQPKEEVEHFR